MKNQVQLKELACYNLVVMIIFWLVEMVDIY